MTLDYLVRRLCLVLLIIWVAATINFFIPRFSNVDPVVARLMREALQGGAMQSGMDKISAEYRAKFGLDKPLWQQYINYLGDMSRLDFGYSIPGYPKTVAEIMRDAIPWTLGLLGFSTVLAFSVGSLLGILLSWPRTPSWVGYLASPFLTLSAIPFYLLGLILAYFLAFQLKWLPLFGGYPPGMIPSFKLEVLLAMLRHAALPAAGIVLSSIGFWALGMRAMMVTTMGEDYMILAQAKGLKERTLIFAYAARNAILPQTTALAISLGHVVSGAVLVEVVFAYPGIGTVLYHAIREMDYFLIQGIVFLIILAIATVMLILDLLLPFLDPRITYRRT